MSGFRGWSATIVVAALAACSGDQRAPADSELANRPGTVTSAPTPTSAKRAVVSARRPRAIRGEFLVKFRAPTSRAYAASVIEQSLFQRRREFSSVSGLHLIRVQPGIAPAQAAATLAAHPWVEYVEPNFIVSADTTPNDPLFAKQWALNNTGQTGGSSTANPDIGALAAWNITTGSANVIVAVTDSGVDYTHQDLAANMFSNAADCFTDGVDHDGDGYVNDCHGINAITGSGDPMDDLFHGTHVAGSIGAVGNNATGISGVNWTVRILACKFLDNTGNGTTADAITCLDYIAMMKDRGFNIIASNNSWSGTPYSQALADAIVAQRQRGILFVAAAGNNSSDNDTLPAYPCSYDLANVICVAASYDALSGFSNYGLGTVHLAAPGEAIWSTVPNNGYEAHDGTSMAAPHVVGTLALLQAQDPSRDWRTLKNLVLAGTVPPVAGTIPTLTGGRLNAAKSMTCSNTVVEARMRPDTLESTTLAVGGTLRLEAININCGKPNGNVVVNVAETGETITLLDDGAGTDEVAGDGIYSGIWVASTPGTFTLTFPGRAGDVINVDVDPLLRSGFPVKMTQVPDVNGIVSVPIAPLTVGDIDGDGHLEIMAPGVTFGPLYAWKSDGSALTGWPNYDVDDVSAVSLGRLPSGTGGLGVVANFGVDLGEPLGLHVYTGDGAVASGWPQATSNVWYPAPTVDVDGDGVDEIIGFPARRADGSVLSASVTVPAMGSISTGAVSGPVAVADLYAVGQPDFVLADNSNIYASSVNGVLPGFPIPTPNASAGGLTYPVIGDVVGDGTPKIIIPTVSWSNGAGYLNVNIFSNTGVLLRTLWTTEPVTNNVVALADLDGDGIPEILASTGTHVYAWKGDGSLMPGWPVSLGTDLLAGQLVVGDVIGDGHPYVVVTSGTYSNGVQPRAGVLHVLDHLGRPAAGFPKPIQSTVGAGAAIADLDGTGRNELIVAHVPEYGTRDSVFVYDLQGAGPFGPVEWGQYMGGADRRGYYELGKNLAHAAFLTTQPHGAGTIKSTDGAINCGTTCIHRYAKGASVTLTATPQSGATFSAWYGPCAGQGPTCTVTASKYTPVAADFASPVTIVATGPGAITSIPAGLSCPGTCSAVFPARTVVTLTASPNKGDAFNGWAGACSGLSLTCTLTVDAAKSVSATFSDHWILALATTGVGTARFTSSPFGISCGATCSAPFAPGTTVTLTAFPDANTYIADWGLPSCPNYILTCPVTLTSNVSATVTLAAKPTIAFTLNGAGTVLADVGNAAVTCSSNCTLPFDPGTAVQIHALPAGQLSTFSSWGGACSGTMPDCELVVNGPQAVTLNFAAKPQIAVTVSGSGQGTVTSSDGLLSCAPTCSDPVVSGTSVTLTATPSSSSTFSGWSGACQGSKQTCTVVVTANAAVGAVFVAVNSSGSGGSKSGGGGSFGLLSIAAMLSTVALRRFRHTRTTDHMIARHRNGVASTRHPGNCRSRRLSTG